MSIDGRKIFVIHSIEIWIKQRIKRFVSLVSTLDVQVYSCFDFLFGCELKCWKTLVSSRSERHFSGLCSLLLLNVLWELNCVCAENVSFCSKSHVLCELKSIYLLVKMSAFILKFSWCSCIGKQWISRYASPDFQLNCQTQEYSHWNSPFIGPLAMI